MDLKELRLKENIRMTTMDTSYLNSQFFVSLEGKQWRVEEAVYLLMKSISQNHSMNDFIEIYKEKTGKDISEKSIDYIIESFLIKRGLLLGTYDTVKKDYLNVKSKFLWGKVPLIKKKYTGFLKIFGFLYYKPCVILCLIITICAMIYSTISLCTSGMDIGDFFRFSISDSFETLIIFFFAALFHEFGHMSYLIKNNISSGDIGFAFYYISPVFYSDVSSAWELPRKKRQILDIGGIYFQSFFLSIFGYLGIIFDRKGFILSFVIGIIYLYNNLNPFLKMDGYWFVSDHMGIPNLSKQMIDYWKNFILRLFKMPNDETLKNNIKQSEYKKFVVYSWLAIGYMMFFSIGLIMLEYKMCNQLYKDIKIASQNVFYWGSILSFLKKDYMLILTFFLLLRVFITAFRKLYSVIIFICKILKKTAIKSLGG